MAEPAQDADRKDLADLYRRNHPEEHGDLTLEIRHESQMFAIRDAEGRLSGLALVSHMDCGVSPYGIIQQLEVARDVIGGARTRVRPELGRCVHWLA